jgi:SAM-dependent methyltransferase
LLRVAAPATDDVDRLACSRCESTWPVRFGIPDLRAAGTGDPYLTPDEDLRAAERLARHGEKEGFASTLASYYASNTRVPAVQARQFIAGALAAAGRAQSVLRTWQAWSGPEGSVTPRALLDVGCGTGPLAVAAAEAGHTTLALDVGLRWLVLAAVRAREAGVACVFACAGAEAMPIATGAVQIVAGESILENVPSPARVLQEMRRVLAPGGWLWMTTANRWSVGPDPHLGLPLGGWLPARVAAAYATWRGRVPPRRNLVGARGLRRLVLDGGFEQPRIGPVTVDPAQRDASSGLMRLAVHAYEALGRLPGGTHLLRTIGPSLAMVARCPVSAPRP